MTKVLILTRFRGEYEPTRLKKEALTLGWEVDLVNYEKIRIGVSDEGKPIIDLGNNEMIENYDLIVPRAASARGKKSMLGVKTIVLEYLENLRNKKHRVINGKSFGMYPLMGKLEQGVLLAQAGLPVIPFSSFNGKSGWKRYLESEPALPVMVKMRFGSHGKNVKLAETKEKLIKLSEKYTEGTVLIQPVVKVRRWYRVIFLNGEVLGMMKHRQKGKFQTEEHKVELNGVKPNFTEEQMNKLREICIGACELFSCDYAGLDVAWDEDRQGWVIFEINRTAQFKWFEKAHKEINVAREILTSR